MGSKLQALLELQEIELQIVDIRRQLARKERQVAAQQTRQDAARQGLEAERKELKRSQLLMDEQDLDLKSRTSHINRLREHLNSVRTNKEYATILAQLNNEKADASRVESRALELMEAVEARKRALGELERVEQEEEQRLTDLRAQLQQVRRSFADRLADLDQKRARAAGNVDRDALNLFNRASERYDGEVMARIVRTHPRRDEFLCEGCHMSLSIECANALMTRDEVLTCKNCGRILYIDKNP